MPILKNTPVPPEAQLLTMPQIEAITQLHRTRVYLFIRKGSFPEPIKMGRTARWPREVVEQWLANVVANGGVTPLAAGAAEVV